MMMEVHIVAVMPAGITERERHSRRRASGRSRVAQAANWARQPIRARASNIAHRSSTAVNSGTEDSQ